MKKNIRPRFVYYFTILLQELAKNLIVLVIWLVFCKRHFENLNFNDMLHKLTTFIDQIPKSTDFK